MVDNTNPTNQFHPYQPQDAVPHADAPATGLNGVLERVGVDAGTIDSVRNTFNRSVGSFNMNGSIGKVRDYARANPAKFLGGLAVAVIGAGLLRRRNS